MHARLRWQLFGSYGLRSEPDTRQLTQLAPSGADGYRIVIVDTTVVLQSPKIASHVPAMRQEIAKALNLGVDQVSVKATTNEGLGSLSAGEGCAAYAVATIEK